MGKSGVSDTKRSVVQVGDVDLVLWSASATHTGVSADDRVDVAFASADLPCFSCPHIKYRYFFAGPHQVFGQIAL